MWAWVLDMPGMEAGVLWLGLQGSPRAAAS